MDYKSKKKMLKVGKKAKKKFNFTIFCKIPCKLFCHPLKNMYFWKENLRQDKQLKP